MPVQAAGRAGPGGDGGGDQHPAHPHQHRGQGAQEHLPGGQGDQTSLQQTEICVREQGEIHREQQSISDFAKKQREASINRLLAASTERLTARSLRLIITLASNIPASLQYCSVEAA